jgi:hypothetical protein
MDLNHLNLRVRDAPACRDVRPDEEYEYVTFRCHDPDGTEIEVFWEAL